MTSSRTGSRSSFGLDLSFRRHAASRDLARGVASLASDDDASAVRWFRRAAQAGNGDAAYELGLLYAKGRGVFVDLPEAVRHFRSAAAKGHPRAELELGITILRACEHGPKSGGQTWFHHVRDRDRVSAERRLALFYPAGLSVEGDECEARACVERVAQRGVAAAMANLGTFCALGIGGNPDDVEARRWYAMAAEAGDIDGCFGLGVLLANGYGGHEDPAAAGHWFSKAADNGHDGALLALGLLHLEGRGVRRDAEAARTLLGQAASHDNPRACHALGQLVLDEARADASTVAEEWFRRAVHQGYAPSMIALSALLEQGDTGNLDEATRWLRAAAEQGHAEAQFLVGTFYASGDRLPRLPSEAMHWFERAAEQDHVAAAINLAVLHLEGDGIRRNPDAAASWYRRAARHGNVVAKLRLGRLLLSNGDVDLIEAEACLREAADAAIPEAALELALLYLSGRAGTPGRDEIANRLISAAKAGLADAQALLGELYASGHLSSETGPDLARATYWYRAAAAAGHDKAMVWLAARRTTKTRHLPENIVRISRSVKG